MITRKCLFSQWKMFFDDTHKTPTFSLCKKNCHARGRWCVLIEQRNIIDKPSNLVYKLWYKYLSSLFAFTTLYRFVRQSSTPCWTYVITEKLNDRQQQHRWVHSERGERTPYCNISSEEVFRAGKNSLGACKIFTPKFRIKVEFRLALAWTWTPRKLINLASLQPGVRG